MDIFKKIKQIIEKRRQEKAYKNRKDILAIQRQEQKDYFISIVGEIFHNKMIKFEKLVNTINSVKNCRKDSYKDKDGYYCMPRRFLEESTNELINHIVIGSYRDEIVNMKSEIKYISKIFSEESIEKIKEVRTYIDRLEYGLSEFYEDIKRDIFTYGKLITKLNENIPIGLTKTINENLDKKLLELNQELKELMEGEDA